MNSNTPAVRHFLRYHNAMATDRRKIRRMARRLGCKFYTYHMVTCGDKFYSLRNPETRRFQFLE